MGFETVVRGRACFASLVVLADVGLVYSAVPADYGAERFVGGRNGVVECMKAGGYLKNSLGMLHAVCRTRSMVAESNEH